VRTEEQTAGQDTVALVNVRDLSKTYRRGPEEVHALTGVTFSLHRHEMVALVGPSGSGKSTLLNVLCGWERPDSGTIDWTDGDMRVERDEAALMDLPWSDLAIVPQRLGLIEELSVRENVELPIRLRSGHAAGGTERTAKLLAGLGLDALAERLPAEISTGEQQRTAMARALILTPRLLLADEPTGHQDEAWARGVLRTLRFAAQEGTSCLVATHNPEAIGFAHRVLAIRDGHVRPGQEQEAADEDLLHLD
jgi:putative ABC transport system ATP-binding protein